MSTPLSSRDDALAWVSAHAASLNDSAADADAVIPVLGAAGLFRIGVPEAQGGSGGSTADAIEAIARVAERSLTAAFVFWGQRTFIEYLLHSPNAVHRQANSTAPVESASPCASRSSPESAKRVEVEDGAASSARATGGTAMAMAIASRGAIGVIGRHSSVGLRTSAIGFSQDSGTRRT